MRLTIVGVQVVDVSVTKRSSRNSVSTNSNARDRANHAKDFVEHRLRNGRIEFSDVEGGGRGRSSVGGSSFDRRGGSVSSSGSGNGGLSGVGSGSGSGDLGGLDGGSDDFRRGSDDGSFGGRHYGNEDSGVGGGSELLRTIQ